MKDLSNYECNGQMDIFDYQERRAGENPTLDTRSEAFETIDKVKRYGQIIECLNENPCMSAKEIAVMMWQKGYIPTSERNFTAPRLTEMSQRGMVEPCGKKKCHWTGKTVAVYRLTVDQMALVRSQWNG